ncbi:hypothetical protein AN640_02715 [Candidatus Epulonipiscium fishelsonii]|uniref:Uncharacterized protein n=1 Tax=Candidatus Epulonipiscium fishelsonii TaxID=77094 RepID=A0ACC8X8Q3_9FIRM|nr:hypothetical protein AN640_02715 [Epulopiscium sp. SCG-D08WGA-EpuloA1]OON91285.1 MAG: hypothetical protein ATN32_10565 [Epulopiscium sp. AS2M-Bin002]
MDNINNQLNSQKSLKNEVDVQRSMIWLLGEIMRTAYKTATFTELMHSVTFTELMSSVTFTEFMQSATDMIMGVTGSSICFLWLNNKDKIVVFERNIYNNNEFITYIAEKSEYNILDKKDIYVYKSEEITMSSSKHQPSDLPKSKIHVPLIDLGGVILEHTQEEYFTTSKQLFLQTLGVFVALNIKTTNMLVLSSKESELDPMTQVYNRRYIDKLFNSIKARAKNKNIMVAIIDIDYFKSINDEKGHDIGDEVIKFVAQLLQLYIRDLHGEVIRYGGDEFVVIVPSDEFICANALNAIKDTYKNSELIRSLNLKSKNNIEMSLTIGMTKYLADYGIKKMITMADEALYEGKHKGKDIVVYNNQNNEAKFIRF